MTKPTTLDEALAKRPNSKTVETDDFVFCVKRFDVGQKLEALRMLAETEEGDDDHAFSVWVSIICMALVNDSDEREFDSKDGKSFIASLEIDDLKELQDAIAEVNGFDRQDEELETAKNG